MPQVTGTVGAARRSLMGSLARNQRTVLYLSTLATYLLGVWLHLPYSGGHVYSDIVNVFVERECTKNACPLLVPYVQTFVEYPVIAAMFMYAMGVLGSHFSGALIDNYYYLTSLFLALPTFLTVRELLKIVELRGGSQGRILWYFVITPTFAFMVLLNWYIIGVYFTVAGIRRFLQGSYGSSGILFGLSAASNLITAVPALGLLIASRSMKDRWMLLLCGLDAFLAINLPFIILNRGLWISAFDWTYNWYVENSWILVLSANIYTPLRHYVPPIVFGAFVLGIVWLRYRRGIDDPIVLAFLSMFGYIFSTYIYSPQMNLTLIPFFVLLPVASYPEFIAFDVANALITVLGTSEILLPLGIVYGFSLTARFSVLWWVEVIRSFWVGKFTVFNGIPSLRALWQGPLLRQSKLVPRRSRSTLGRAKKRSS